MPWTIFEKKVFNVYPSINTEEAWFMTYPAGIQAYWKKSFVIVTVSHLSCCIQTKCNRLKQPQSPGYTYNLFVSTQSVVLVMRCHVFSQIIWLNPLQAGASCSAWNRPSLSPSIPQAVIRCFVAASLHWAPSKSATFTDLRSVIHYPGLIHGQLCQSVTVLNYNKGLLLEISGMTCTWIKTLGKLSLQDKKLENTDFWQFF